MLTTYSYNAEAESYWKLLKNARSEVKLRLITLLSQSVINDVEHHARPESDASLTKQFLDKYSGIWSGNDTAEGIISRISENRNCKNPIRLTL